MNVSKIIITVVLSILVLSGCNNQSEEEVVSETKEIAKTTFEDKTEIVANNQVDDRPVYIPNKLDIQSGDENNLILENGNQLYIVFHNTIEPRTSKLNYQSVQVDDALILESYEDEEKFGYIRVLEDKGEGYELQVGVGGAKITTYTKKRNMVEDAKEMMKTAKFLALQE